MQSKQLMSLFAFSLILLLALTACAGTRADRPETATGSANTQREVTSEDTSSQAEVTSGEDTSAQQADTSTEGTDPQKKVSSAEEAETQQETTSTEDEPTLLAGTNIARHNVPLEEIHFDTFNGSSIPLSKITESLVLQLRDAIPPITKPKYMDVETADTWLKPDDIVLGYVDGDTALAYPVRILNYHEIVNETVNGVPILISFCPLCNSGIVYDRRLEGQVLEFGNTSALYESDLVMYDKQTMSYWFQVGGEAIIGDLTGKRLNLLPTRFMRWSEWREAYPESQVLSRDTGFRRPYERDPFVNLSQYLNQGHFPFPVGEAARNPALPAGEKVIGLIRNDEARAYSIATLAGQVVNDTISGLPVAIAVDEVGTSWAFNRRVGEQVVTLEWDGDTLMDQETGSRWSLTGQAIEGPLSGEQLEPLATRFSFWFAFVAAFPEATVFQ